MSQQVRSRLEQRARDFYMVIDDVSLTDIAFSPVFTGLHIQLSLAVFASLCPPHHLFLDKTPCLVCYLLRLGTLLAGLLLATHGCECMQITHAHMDVNAYTHTESVEAKQVAQQEVRSAMQRVRSMF